MYLESNCFLLLALKPKVIHKGNSSMIVLSKEIILDFSQASSRWKIGNLISPFFNFVVSITKCSIFSIPFLFLFAHI